MLNQLRSERDDFREYVVRFHNAMTEKNDVIYVLYESELMTEQANDIVRNYQKRIIELQRKINIIELRSLKEDSKNDHSDEPFKSRSDLTQIIKKNKFTKQFDLSVFINDKKSL